jgi:hypothetical protein
MSSPLRRADGKPQLGRAATEEGLDEADRKLIADVERVGWHVVLIPEQDGTPGWAFSIGLWRSFGHPEFVVFGLPLELSGQVINALGQRARAGETFAAGADAVDLLAGVRCTFRRAQRRWYPPFLGYARWYYRGDEFPVLQCIWPDKKQRYPWDAEFKREWLWAQPLLFETEPGPARVEELLRTIGDE